MRAPILLATRSAGKLRELEPLFAAAGYAVRSLASAGIAETEEEEGVETFDSFEENALAKARFFLPRWNGPVIADDSGLAVRALDEAPGVRSKRWSGRGDLSGIALDEANNAVLRSRLHGVADRRARYVCAAAYVDGEREIVRIGETSGRIIDEPAGAEGFGYDPYFLSDDLGVTFGAATRDAKEAVSHRGRAFRALLAALGSAR